MPGKSRKKRPRLKRPVPISDVFAGKGIRKNITCLVGLYRVQKAWGEIVGKELAERTYPKRVQGKTLVVAVESPAWAHHLSMMREQILDVVRDRSKTPFSRIRFVNERFDKLPASTSTVNSTSAR